MNFDLQTLVAQLDGFLSGLASIDGRIRQFTAHAFPLQGGEIGPQQQISEFYKGQANFEFHNGIKFDHGLKQVETEIQTFLLRDPFGSKIAINSEVVLERKRFLAFRILDLIDQISPETHDLNSVWKFEGKAHNSESICTFFCFKTNAGYLVLQFNDDSAWVGMGGTAKN